MRTATYAVPSASAVIAGVASWRIRQQTSHSGDAMLTRYVCDGELLTENAAEILV